ncbi:MAG: ABC transporter permease [Desulfobacterales bacterium]|uniref:ABC transporter permease n=1 Tax=Candidatus Desulfaltia bathyphila TaxID=2841697 RepID=A0A8J6N4X1_9BACT|nr:ABC transporter permease [Candidatus Desulfaltia bathyphila]MBL7195556.1 ABC transporter permease [Desulfobacterales bacterium]MBL7207423.1 ABC transporter permease [Desulfobacterales bacterium]
MDLLLDSFLSALLLIWSIDPELLVIVQVSLKVSAISTLIAGVVGIPAGFLIAFRPFRGKRLVITVLNTLLAMPTVVIGLFVYAFISRRGIFGAFDLLYTQKAIIIGQMILIIPIVTTFTIAAISRIDERYRKTALTLGANVFQTALIIIREARFGIVASIIVAFGRVIAEVGISMMLGGNAKGFTRTMTTAMALEYDKGEFVLSVALGIVLLMVSFGMNVFFNYFQGKARV